MKRYGRIVGNYVVDVYDADSVGELEKKLGVTGFVEVPADTLSGDLATHQQDGSYTFQHPAAAPTPQLQPLALTGSEFHTYCAGVFAQVNKTTALQGLARLGDVLHALDGQGGLIKIAAVRYAAAGNPGGKYTFSDASVLIDALATASIVTADEQAAFKQGWPKG